MSRYSAGKRYKPLPLRRDFWREYLSKLNNGVVLLADNPPEQEDVRNAAQAILIDYSEPRLQREFVRPILSPSSDFYAAFMAAYSKAIRETELNVWSDMCGEVIPSTAVKSGGGLSGEEAAVISYMRLEHSEPPSRDEYYMNLAVFARVYEELLREKYQEHYTPEVLYNALRQHMRHFVMRLIGFDSVISTLLIMNSKPPELVDEDIILNSDTILDRRFLHLDAKDVLFFNPKFVEAVYEHAADKNIREDSVGRTEDRGCPVLHAKECVAVLDFAIEELIAQHQIHTQGTRPGG